MEMKEGDKDFTIMRIILKGLEKKTCPISIQFIRQISR